MVTSDAPVFSSDTPPWLASMQTEAWRAFTQSAMPTRKSEAWRFADLGQLALEGFGVERDSDGAGDFIAASVGVVGSLGKVVLVDDLLVHVDGALAAAGVMVSTLRTASEAAQMAASGLRSSFDSEKLVALHQANVSDAIVIEVAAGVECQGVVEIFHWARGGQRSVFPRTVVIGAARSKVVIVEHHRSADEGAQWSLGATQLLALEGARVEYVLVQQRNRASRVLQFTSTHAAKDAQVLHGSVQLGARWSRGENVSHLDGAGSRSDMIGVALTDGDQESDQRTLQLHHAPHAQSDLLYKNVLFGKSRSIFAGLIVVDEGAHFTDAYQTCRNLLMTDECEANAMPGLEINADQVKCSHGSTSGSIPDDEIFYLRSRGIAGDEARALLAQGFVAQTLERISAVAVREYVMEQVEQRFAQIAIA